MPAIEVAAAALGFQLTIASGNDEAETQRAIEAFAGAGEANGGLIVPPGAKIAARRGLIVRLAAQHRIPAVYSFGYIAEEGGLVSYGPETLDLYRRPAAYVDRILKGAKPAELPIQQPTNFELIANLKTAKAMGLSIPESVLLRADKVIE